MNWDAITAIGEIVGAIAVVVSLLYLAIQIRAQNRESRMAAVHDILAAFREIQTPMQDAEISKLWLKARAGHDALENHEKVQFYNLIGPMLRVWEEAYFQFDSGRLDEEIWETMVAQYSELVAMPEMQKYWALHKHVYAKRFSAFVDGIEVGENKL